MRPRRRFLAFCVIGTAGFLVDLATLYATAPSLGWYGGRVTSFVAAVTTTWYFNRRLTFADASLAPGQTLWRQYLRYVVAMLGGAALNYLVYALTLEFLPIAHAPAWGVAFGCIAGLSVNFASARLLVFRRARPHA